MNAEIKTCTCKHEAQDKLHGKQMRVMNSDLKKGFTCTVCGAKHK
jgi:hypothetical protein